MSVEVKKSQHKYIIGPKGNSINEILKETGVFVEMPSSDSTSETITLRGPQEKLGLGESLITKSLFCCKESPLELLLKSSKGKIFAALLFDPRMRN